MLKTGTTMIAQSFLKVLLPSAAAATVVALATGEAYGEFASRGGSVLKPDSSVEKPEDIGRSAHTNFNLFVPNAGKANEQFSRDVAPEQTGGPPFAGYFYETPASLGCVSKLVPNPVAGCNPNTVTANPPGGSRAIAIVDAYHYPTAASDLSVFSNQFGLPQANFQVVFASGRQPPVNANWNIEEALDIEWAHAMAPGAKIYLVEAASASFSALLQAITVANSLLQAAGGGEVSMSWGGSEFSGETSYDAYFTQPGVVYFAAAGDSPGVIWPSTSPNVVSAGGTSISRNPTTGALQAQVTWQDGGGGPSLYETRPSYQNGVSAIVGGLRGTPDVAADANPSSGVWVYSYPYWYIVGGTSVASPVWAGIVNAAGSFRSSSQAELTNMYATLANPPGSPAYASDFNDITSGTCGPNQGYQAAVGWDFCTGLGSTQGEAGE
jgi:kumamolisin